MSGKEEEAVSVFDNRDIWGEHPNNDVLVICDHASSQLKGFKFEKTETDKLPETYDAGAGELAVKLAERLECLAVCSNFSKVIIDPSRPVSSPDLVPTHWADGSPISFNYDRFRLWERLSNYYLEYHKILRESLIFLEAPRVIICINSHLQEDTDLLRAYSPNTKIEKNLGEYFQWSLEGNKIDEDSELPLCLTDLRPQDQGILSLESALCFAPQDQQTNMVDEDTKFGSLMTDGL